MKLLFVILAIVVVIVTLRVGSHKPIVVENMRQYQCDTVNPTTAVASYFKHPFYAHVIKKYQVTEIREQDLVISGYTWFGIELNRALYTCNGIKTLKSF
jgi:hypothetical protein